MSIVELIVILLLFCVVAWGARYLLAAFNMPSQIQAIVTVVIVLVFVLWLVAALGFGVPVLRR